MINKIKIDECVLCKACSNVCPKNAISFVEEYHSFLFPRINPNSCIECKKCDDVCPSINYSAVNNVEKVRAVAGNSKNDVCRMNSSSGGIFKELADYILSVNGYVVGAIMDIDFQVKHVISNDNEVINHMMGSKYIQSDMKDVYRDTSMLLKRDVTVLFTGTPCEIYALHQYLGKEYDNLFTVDLVCHGTTSYQMLNEYLNNLASRYNSCVESVSFRDKTKGWHASSLRVNFKTHRPYSNLITIDPFMRAFLSGINMKPSCYNCKYKNFSSKSDITLGDLWGSEVFLSEYDDNKGLSAIFINTDKGKDLVNELDINLYNVDKNEVIKYNQNIINSTTKSKNYEEFYQYALTFGYGKAIIHFFKESNMQKIKRVIRGILRDIYYIVRGKDKPFY